MFLFLCLSYVLSVYLCFSVIPFVTAYKEPGLELERPQNESIFLLCLTCHIINLLFPNTFKDDRLCALIYGLFERKCVCGSDIVYMQGRTNDCLSKSFAGQIPLSVG